MANTFVALASTEISTNTSSIVFDSIPQTYTDLILICFLRVNDATVRTGIRVQPNNVTTSSTAGGYTVMYGYNGTAGGGSTGNTIPFNNIYDATGTSATADVFGQIQCFFPNYAGNKNKSMNTFGSSETAAGGASSFKLVGRTAQEWRSTAAITKLTIECGLDFVSGSRFDLYGIKNS